MRVNHTGQTKASAERVVKDIWRATRSHFSAEDKIRMVLEDLSGEDSIAELCRSEGIAQSLHYMWSKLHVVEGIYGLNLYVQRQAQTCRRRRACCHLGRSPRSAP